MKIAIIHLDLGQGGAERQTIDEAMALKALGHDVLIVTSHHDNRRCFEETIDPNALGKNIEVYGDWIPRHIFGRFHALMSIYRMLWCTLRLMWTGRQFDMIFIDQVSAVIPFAKMMNGGAVKVVFYCHFPDLLLAQNVHRSIIKRFYRLFIDWFEQITTACADELLVNSNFTKAIVDETFPIIAESKHLTTKVVYPAINTDQFAAIAKEDESLSLSVPKENDFSPVIFLSINRFERKKEIDRAIHALFHLHQSLKTQSNGAPPPHRYVKLIIAGGYDERLLENREYFNELLQLCKTYNLRYQFVTQPTFQQNETDADDEKTNRHISHSRMFAKLRRARRKASQSSLVSLESIDDKSIVELSSGAVMDRKASVYFITKFPDSMKEELFKQCNAVLYTPENEHFGIVPIEAMLASRPVIACNSGGPLETVVSGETGFLCDANAETFAKQMRLFVEMRSLTYKMGKAGRQRVMDNFGHNQLQKVLRNVVTNVGDKRVVLPMQLKLSSWAIMTILLFSFVLFSPLLGLSSQL